MPNDKSRSEFTVTEKDINEYIPDPENANLGTERGASMIKDSIKEHGLGRSLVADKHGILVAGNKAKQGAIDAGITKVIEIETDGDAIIVHKRRDWDLLEDESARLYAYADNRSSEVSLNWDAAQIFADQEAGIDLSGSFTAKELRLITASQVERDSSDGPDARIEEIEEIHKKWNACLGDLWVIPSAENDDIKHRIVCGDSTSPETVDFAIDDNAPFIMVTDPPYGVNYDPGWRDEYDKKKGITTTWHSLGKVKNDDSDNWEAAYKLFPGDVIYVWHGALHVSQVAQNIIDCDYQLRAHIIWMKQALVMSRGHYHWQHESCFYAVRNGKKSNWHGDRKQSTIWQVANMGAVNKSEEDKPTGHGTQKPIELMRRPIINHTLPGDCVYEPFAGAGTTMIAAELTARNSIGIELDERYVSLTLQRFEDLGLTPYREVAGDNG